MKNFIKICVSTMIITSAVPAMAEQPATPPALCFMMGNMNMMQKNMAWMMQSMDSMMKGTSDAAIKERMQKMHSQMSTMMSDMQKMGSNMGGMMGQGMMPCDSVTPKP